MISRETFQLFHIIPIPVLHDDQLISLNLESRYLAVNMDRSRFWKLDDKTIHSCKKLKTGKIICFNGQQMFSPEKDLVGCEKNLLTHKNIPHKNCEIKVLSQAENVIWIKMHAQNNWMAYTRQKQAIDIICDTTIKTVFLEGVSTIQLEPGCQIKNANTIINAVGTNYSEIHNAFIPVANLSNTLTLYQIDKVPETYLKKSTNLQDLQNFIQHQKEMNKKTPPININHHDIQQYCMIYIIIFAIFCGGIWYKVKYTKIINKCKEKNNAPIAAPRSLFELSDIVP